MRTSPPKRSRRKGENEVRGGSEKNNRSPLLTFQNSSERIKSMNSEILAKHWKWLRNEKGGERANLADANLVGANLTRANLTNANLVGAYLAGANLKGTCLDPEAPLPETDLSELEEKDGWYYGYRTQKSQVCGNTVYEPGKSYTAPYFSVSVGTDCHPGIYLAPSLAWLKERYPDEPLVRVRAKHVLKASDKYRAKYMEVLYR